MEIEFYRKAQWLSGVFVRQKLLCLTGRSLHTDSITCFVLLPTSHTSATIADLKIRRTIKGPVKLIKRVIHFLQSVSDQFHIIILSLPM